VITKQLYFPRKIAHFLSCARYSSAQLGKLVS